MGWRCLCFRCRTGAAYEVTNMMALLGFVLRMGILTYGKGKLLHFLQQIFLVENVVVFCG